MRCKKHRGDYSSSVGVCASCLRERLISLIAAQQQQQQQQHQPPPFLFPRSVSPYVARRKSQDQHHPRFYSTPQVGPTHNYSHSWDFPGDQKTRRDHHHLHNNNNKSQHLKRKGRGRLSLLSTLFRSRSEELDHPDPPRFSWFSPFHRNNKSTPSSSSEHRPCRRVVDRGMSPARGSDSEDDDSSRNTPAVVRRGKKGGDLRKSSGISFCLSPLVWASPHRHWSNHKCLHDVVVADARPRNLHMAASFCANRSRKLADFGRGAH